MWLIDSTSLRIKQLTEVDTGREIREFVSFRLVADFETQVLMMF